MGGGTSMGTARARGDRRRQPITFRRKTHPTAKPQPALVVEDMRRGTQPENNPEKKKELLMVGVPRRHSARLLLLHLVMVGVPTNTFAMDENKPETVDGGGPTNTFSKVSV